MTPPNRRITVALDIDDDTRDYLEHISGDELDEIKKDLRFIRSVRRGARYTKWAVGMFVGALVAMATIGDFVIKIAAYWTGRHP